MAGHGRTTGEVARLLEALRRADLKSFVSSPRTHKDCTHPTGKIAIEAQSKGPTRDRQFVMEEDSWNVGALERRKESLDAGSAERC